MKSFYSTDPVSGNGKTNTWLTPYYILDVLGEFDLDPCAHRDWITANNRYYDRGLERPWKGRVWLNPPYGREISVWLDKLQHHGNGIALVFARTDTTWFQKLKFDAALFIRGRISFISVTDFKKSTNAGAPNVLLAFGKQNIKALLNIPGLLLYRSEGK